MKKNNFIKIPSEIVDEIIDNMVEIILPEEIKFENGDESSVKSSPFIIVRNLLSRMGILKDNKLFQTAHILKKRNKYYICHFKQLFMLDGLNSEGLNERDTARLLKIACLLEQWGLVKIVNRNLVDKFNNGKNIFINIIPINKIKSGEIICVKKYDL